MATKRQIVFVCPNPVGESLRCARAIKRLERVSLLGVCEGAPDAHSVDVFDDLVLVKDIHDVAELLNNGAQTNGQTRFPGSDSHGPGDSA